MAQTRLRLVLIPLVVALGLAASVHAAKPVKPVKPAAKPAPKSALVVAGTTLALPANCKVKVRWVCPPLDAKTVEDSHWYDTRFVVDSAGRPWFGADRDNIISPTQQYQFTFNHLYNDIVCLANGTFLVTTESDLGFVTPPEKPQTDYNGVPLALVQPVAGLPLPRCRLYPGAGNCVYLAGWNPKTEMYDIFMLRPEKLAIGGAGVREYVKVFSSKKQISAVTGDGQKTYVAIDTMILKVSGSDCTRIHAEQQGSIRSLAYSPEAGLFYTTYGGIGYIGTNGTLQLMAATEPQIYLQNGSLYVFFAKTMGVVALDNIQDLKRYSLALKPVPATQSSEVKVTDVRFFEAGETAPEYGDRQYATKFSKASTRYVYCQVDMTNLLKGKRGHKQLVTMELIGPNEVWGGFEEIRFDFKPDHPGLAGWARFGSASPGTFYPGAYTLKTCLNGSRIDERRFAVEGEPSVDEAARYGDTAKLWRLLDAGGDANAANSDGQTPLIAAVDNGKSLENIRLLLDHRADINAKDGGGNTALLVASQPFAVNIAAIRLLLDAGADANIADNDGQTPLHKAVDGNSVEAVRLLLEHGANPNARDNDQYTPLMKASLDYGRTELSAKPEVVELLLSHGADTNAANKDGGTPFWQVLHGKDPELVRLFIQHGADVNAVGSYDSGTRYSALGDTLIAYNLESDRIGKNGIREIIRVLCDSGAKLLREETSYAVTSGTIRLLGRKQIAVILDQNEDAVLQYQPDDPWLQRYVLKRLVQMAYLKLSWASSTSDFSTSLNLCQEAKTRAEKWNLQSLVPELYYNIGMLSIKVSGDRDAARQSLQKYLELAPDGWKAGPAKEMLNGL